MAKKIKRSKTGAPAVDPNLEEVEEERAFEIELDEESNEILFVHHYRRMWGDGFDSDIEHVFTVEEARQMVVVLMKMIDDIRTNAMRNIEEKATPTPIEKNPLRDNRVD